MNEFLRSLIADPLEHTPALIGVAAGLFVLTRHRRDRRAQVFLTLMTVEAIVHLMPMWLASVVDVPTADSKETLTIIEDGLVDPLTDSVLLFGALLWTIAFMHFGASFPHARRWLRRRAPFVWYGIAPVAGILNWLALRAGLAEQPSAFATPSPAIAVIGLAMALGILAAPFWVYRSYREMTLVERHRFRVPVIGVLVGMIASFAVDLILAFAPVPPAENLLSTVVDLLVPFLFYIATVKYQLLDQHSQDYVVKL